MTYYWDEPESHIPEKIRFERRMNWQGINFLYYPQPGMDQSAGYKVKLKGRNWRSDSLFLLWSRTGKRIFKHQYLGIGGVLTFKNAKKIKRSGRVCAYKNRIVLETDCPLYGAKHQTEKRNSSLNLLMWQTN